MNAYNKKCHSSPYGIFYTSLYACFTIFSDEANVKQFVKQDVTLAQKVHDFFVDLIDRMKKALQSLSKRNKEYNALSKDIEVKEKIVSMFNDCLKESQKNNTTTSDSEIKYSKKLGEFADIKINSDDELNHFGITNTANNLNDYVGIQKVVVSKLKSNDFFNNNANVVLNADTDIVVEITPNGIRETLSSGKRYYELPRKFKIAKISSVRSLPELIKYAEIVRTESDNKNRTGVSFVVLEHPLTIDNEKYNVEMKIRKTPQGNKFYIHQLQLQKTHSAGETDAKNSRARSLNSLNVSADNISQDNSDVKLSLKEDINKHKEKQLSIIEKHNPAPDSYHTWIRSINDKKY